MKNNVIRKQKQAEKKKAKRVAKKKEISKVGKLTKAKKAQIVELANRARETRRMELLGLAVMFKIVNGRNIEETDKFSPADISKLCVSFLEKHKKMKKAEQQEFSPLLPLATRKIAQAKEYADTQKILIQQAKDKEKLEKEEDVKTDVK